MLQFEIGAVVEIFAGGTWAPPLSSVVMSRSSTAELVAQAVEQRRRSAAASWPTAEASCAIWKAERLFSDRLKISCARISSCGRAGDEEKVTVGLLAGPATLT